MNPERRIGFLYFQGMGVLNELKRKESQYYPVELKPEHLTTSVLPENLYFPRIINPKLFSEEMCFLLSRGMSKSLQFLRGLTNSR